MKNYPGIIVRQHHTDQKRMGLLREQCVELKEGTSAVLLQSGLGEKWWADSMECYCYLRNIQDPLSDGRHPMKGGLEYHLNGPVIPFGSMVECHPVSAERPIESAPILLLKSCQFYSLDLRSRGENLERRRYGRRH